MKVSYKQYAIKTSGAILKVSLSGLIRALGLSGQETTGELPASVLESLKVQLTSPSVSGGVPLKMDSRKACYYEVSGNELLIHLSKLSAGIHRLSVSAVYGTDAGAELVADIEVPANIPYLLKDGVYTPLERYEEKDQDEYKAYAYKYGEVLVWLDDFDFNKRVTAFVASGLDATLEDASEEDDCLLVKDAEVAVYDDLGSVDFIASDSIGGAGGGGAVEVVNIQLKTEDGEGSVEGVEVAVTVDGETEERTYYTDENGKCSFQVTHGLNYTIAFGQIEGYREIADLAYLSSLSVRNITETYTKDITVTQEHVKVTLSYTGGDSQYRAEAVKVIVGGETQSHAVVNNVAEFDVPLGETYEIVYNDVNSYATPRSHTYTAELHTRLVNVSYIGAVEGLTWIKYDGSSVAFNDITEDMKAEVVGLRIANDTLIEGQATFVVPLEYLLGEKSIGSKQWCSQNVQFQQLPLIGNAATALLPANADGEGNTLAVVEEAENGSTTVTAGTAVPAFTAVQAVKYTINEVEKTCFLGSYAQMKAFSDNRTDINTICLDRFGKICIAVNSGLWWASTQNSATYAVYLANGGFNNLNRSKTGSYSVVPFLAY